MKQITKAVEKIINKNLIFRECLYLDIINFSNLAGLIKDDVEKLVGKTVRKETIVVCLSRYKKAPAKTNFFKNVVDMVKGSSIKLRTDVNLVFIKKTKANYRRLREIYNKINLERNDMYYIMEGLERLQCYIDGRNMDLISEVFNEDILLVQEVSLISVYFPALDTEVPGLLEFFTKELSSRNISVEIITMFKEIMLIVDKKNSIDAFKIISNHIDFCKNLYN